MSFASSYQTRPSGYARESALSSSGLSNGNIRSGFLGSGDNRGSSSDQLNGASVGGSGGAGGGSQRSVGGQKTQPTPPLLYRADGSGGGGHISGGSPRNELGKGLPVHSSLDLERPSSSSMSLGGTSSSGGGSGLIVGRQHQSDRAVDHHLHRLNLVGSGGSSSGIVNASSSSSSNNNNINNNIISDNHSSSGLGYRVDIRRSSSSSQTAPHMTSSHYSGNNIDVDLPQHQQRSSNNSLPPNNSNSSNNNVSSNNNISNGGGSHNSARQISSDEHQFLLQQQQQPPPQQQQQQHRPQSTLSTIKTPILPKFYFGPEPPLPLDNLERAVKWHFDPLDSKWQCSLINIKVDKRPFAEGAMRYAYKLLNLSESSDDREYVMKMCKSNKKEEENTLWEDAQIQSVAKLWAHKYNEDARVPKKIDFLVCYVLQLVDRPDEPLVTLEKFVKGEYVKWSNNWEFTDERRNTPHAFSHFSYESSGHRLVVCDMQGVGDLYTDPQIHSVDGTFGNGNLGVTGISAFCRNHKCNALCRDLDLPPLGERYKADDQGTCAVEPQKRWQQQPVIRPYHSDAGEGHHADDRHHQPGLAPIPSSPLQMQPASPLGYSHRQPPHSAPPPLQSQLQSQHGNQLVQSTPHSSQPPPHQQHQQQQQQQQPPPQHYQSRQHLSEQHSSPIYQQSQPPPPSSSDPRGGINSSLLQNARPIPQSQPSQQLTQQYSSPYRRPSQPQGNLYAGGGAAGGGGNSTIQPRYESDIRSSAGFASNYGQTSANSGVNASGNASNRDMGGNALVQRAHVSRFASRTGTSPAPAGVGGGYQSQSRGDSGVAPSPYTRRSVDESYQFRTGNPPPSSSALPSSDRRMGYGAADWRVHGRAV